MTDVMHNFELYQPASVADAQSILEESDDAWIIAGGKDSLGWFKDRVMQPSVVVDIAGIEGLHGIREEDGGGLWIGAITTLTEVSESEAVRIRFPALSEAAANVASPQIRNAGTIGGNVMQDTRCVYYRDGFPCYRAGGNTCYANTPTAMNREHALFGVSRCVAVTPSDTAPALSAIEATFVIEGRDGAARGVRRRVLHRPRNRHHAHDLDREGRDSSCPPDSGEMGRDPPVFRKGGGSERLGFRAGEHCNGGKDGRRRDFGRLDGLRRGAVRSAAADGGRGSDPG